MTEPPTQFNVLITRPQHQAARLRTLIEQAGGHAEVVPVIEILPSNDPDAIRATIGDVDEYDFYVFISTNAVRYAHDYLPASGQLGGRIAAVGPTTATALRDAGLRCDIQPKVGYSSEDLLNESELLDVDKQRVLIFRGADGRTLLGDTLQERGASVTYANVYRRQPPAESAARLQALLDADSTQFITATSVETLTNIVAMAGDARAGALQTLRLVTASPRVVKMAQQLGFAQTAILASAPDDASLTGAIVDWRRAQTGDVAVPIHDDDAQARPPARETGVTMTSDDKQQPTNDMQPADEDAQPGTNERGAPETIVAVMPPKPPKSGRVLAALALLISLLAGGIAGYTWWENRAAQANVADALGALDALDALEAVPDAQSLLSESRRMSEESGRALAQKISRDVDNRLRKVDLSAVDDLGQRQNDIENQVKNQSRSISTLTNRLSGMEQDLSAMQGVSASVRNTWVRAEAEYFLQTANSRLQLAGDVRSALEALRAADERIGALGDPGLTPVRAKLTSEILAVEAVRVADVEGMALTLNGMAARIPKLPFRSQMETNFARERDAPDGDVSGLERAKQSIAGVFSGIVRVRPVDGDSIAHIAPAESYFLGRNIELQLQVARLALMQQDQVNFRSSLKTADEWLATYYDGEDQGVATMRQRLDDMRKIQIDPELPDISGSLRMLRNIVAASSTSQ